MSTTPEHQPAAAPAPAPAAAAAAAAAGGKSRDRIAREFQLVEIINTEINRIDIRNRQKIISKTLVCTRTLEYKMVLGKLCVREQLHSIS